MPATPSWFMQPNDPRKTAVSGGGGGGMYTPNLLQPAPSSPFQYAPEPVEGGDNSLIRAIRSIQGQMGVRGEELYGQGQGLFNRGAGVIGKGLSTLQSPLAYWQAILSGGPEMTAALSPEIQRISQGYAQASNAVRQFAPSGGGRASLMTQLPYKQAADVSNLFSTIRPKAAEGVRGIAGDISGVGKNLLDAALSKLSLSNQLAQILQLGQLGVRGQDIEESGQWKQILNDLGKSLGKIIGAKVAGGGD